MNTEMPQMPSLPHTSKKRPHLRNGVSLFPILAFLGTWLFLPTITFATPEWSDAHIIQTSVEHYGWVNITLSTQWHGKEGQDLHDVPLPGSIVHIQIIETYDDVLPKECSLESELPANCRPDNPKVIYQGYVQTNQAGTYNLILHLRGYYYLDAKLVKVQPEFESLISNVPDEYQQTLLGFDSTNNCSLTPEVKLSKYIYRIGEPIVFNLRPKPSGCGKETPDRYYRVEYGDHSEDFRVPASGKEIEFDPGNTEPGMITIHILDEPQPAVKIGGLSLTTEFISFPPIFQTLEELQESQNIPNSSRVYSERPIFRDNAFNVFYYEKSLVKNIQINPNGFDQTTITVFPIDEIAELSLKNINAKLCTQTCVQLERTLKQQDDGSLTYTVPKQFDGEDAELFVYADDPQKTDIGIKVTIPPGIINPKTILMTIGVLLSAFGIAILVRRNKLLSLLPPMPGPKDDRKEYIHACVRTVYRHLLGKEMEACSDPAKLLYQDADMKQLSHLKEIEQYCAIIRNALLSDMTDETIRTVRKHSMRMLKYPKA